VSVLIQSDVLDEEYHIEFCQSLVRGGTCAIGAALFLLVLQQCACDKGVPHRVLPITCTGWHMCNRCCSLSSCLLSSSVHVTRACQSKLIDRRAKSVEAALVHLQ